MHVAVCSCTVFSPGAPTSDADTLDDVDAELTDVHEEENKEPEWAVTPTETEKKAHWHHKQHNSGAFYSCIQHKKHLCRLPKCSIKRSVPADEWTRREEHRPEDGQAEVDPTCSVHAEPGHAAHKVSEQRPCVNYAWEKKREKWAVSVWTELSVKVGQCGCLGVIVFVWAGGRLFLWLAKWHLIFQHAALCRSEGRKTPECTFNNSSLPFVLMVLTATACLKAFVH